MEIKKYPPMRNPRARFGVGRGRSNPIMRNPCMLFKVLRRNLFYGDFF
jgi:hypothetical protein